MSTPVTPPTPAPSGPLGWIEHTAQEVETGILNVEKFVGNLPTIYKEWATLEPAVQAVVSQAFLALWAALDSAGTLAGDAATGNIAIALVLAPQTVAAFQQVYADALAGEKEIVSALKALGAAF